MVRLEAFLLNWAGVTGRPPADRVALARSFVTKMIYRINTTKWLIDRLIKDKGLRRICGWERQNQVPSESTFSRAFSEFAESELPTRVHEALTVKTQKGKQGRPNKGEKRPKEKRRLERQQGMSLPQMLEDLPRQCNVGTKRNSKGYKTSWTGYKLHVDVADGGIPVSCVLTSASLHDSQVAIPLATITNKRTTNLYDLMDSTYDAPEIKDHSRLLGHVPIIDTKPRSIPGLKQELEDEAKRQKRVGHRLAEDIRYNERSSAERVMGRIKDDFGENDIRVRGDKKVMCHLMFGFLALTVDQLMRFVT